jgi:hypothetical protein
MGSAESYCVLIPGTGSDALDRPLFSCNASRKATGDVIDNGNSDHPEGGGVEGRHFSRPNSVPKIAHGQSSIGSRALVVGGVGEGLDANKSEDLQFAAQMDRSAVTVTLKSVHHKSPCIGIATTGRCAIRCDDAVINGVAENSPDECGGNDEPLARFREDNNRDLITATAASHAGACDSFRSIWRSNLTLR